jgi:ketosteroid isomerase-like protein
MKKVTLLTGLLYLLIFNGCNNEVKLPEDYEAQVTAQISELMTKYAEALDNGDQDTFWSCCDEDYLRLNSKNVNVVSTLAENIETYKSYFAKYSYDDVITSQIDLVVDHDYAFGISLLEYKEINNEEQDIAQRKSRGFYVYKKQEEGSWKIFRFIMK